MSQAIFLGKYVLPLIRQLVELAVVVAALVLWILTLKRGGQIRLRWVVGAIVVELISRILYGNYLYNPLHGDGPRFIWVPLVIYHDWLRQLLPWLFLAIAAWPSSPQIRGKAQPVAPGQRP